MFQVSGKKHMPRIRTVKRRSSLKNHVSKKEIYVVLTHATWCGFCKELMPHWKKIRKDTYLKPKCEFVEIESANVERDIGKYKNMIGGKDIPIPGYPTIFLIKNGILDIYDGERTDVKIIQWIRGKIDNKDLNVVGNKMNGGKKTRRARKHSCQKPSCEKCNSGNLFKFW